MYTKIINSKNTKVKEYQRTKYTSATQTPLEL
jgi:hypothetical protein